MNASGPVPVQIPATEYDQSIEIDMELVVHSRVGQQGSLRSVL